MEYEPLPIISKDFPKVVIPLIENASDSIDIVVYDWRFSGLNSDSPLYKFNLAIENAVKRGVVVRCLLQNTGVVDRLKRMGCNARVLNSKKILHTKLIIFDKVKLVIGSHNYTQHAFTSNHEASIFVEMKNKNNALVEYFNNLFGL